MAVDVLTGKPGGGKSYRATQLIVEALVHTKRAICTNLAIKIPEICAYLRKIHGEDFNAGERIRILTNEECLAFWLFPAPHVSHDVKVRLQFKSPEGRVLSVPDFTERKALCPFGTFYAIDEAHTFFSARNWQGNSDEGHWYLTQHRKYNDEILFITQFLEYLDKRYRSIAERYIYVRNRTNTNLPILGGMFRGIPGFSQSVYLEPYRLGLDSIETKFIRQDWEGIGSLYDTAAGVGVVGFAPEEKRRKKGMPMWVMALPVLAVLGLIASYPAMMRKVLAPSDQVQLTPAKAEVRPQQTLSPSIQPAESKSEKIQEEPEWLTGFFYVPGKGVACVTSRGVIYDARNPEVVGFGMDAYGRYQSVKLYRATLRLMSQNNETKR